MRWTLLVFGLFLGGAQLTGAQQFQEPSPEPAVLQGNLTALGSTPFHLKAKITEGRDPNPIALVEVYWVAPNKWRRNIRSRDFSQLLIVDRDKVSEQDGSDYFPLGLQTLVTAMIDPASLLESRSAESQLPTKAQCGSLDGTYSASLARSSRLFLGGAAGPIDTVLKAGHSVRYAKYQEFEGKNVARLLTFISNLDERLTAEITDLRKEETPDQDNFAISETTPAERRIKSAVLSDVEFRVRVLGTKEIVWPQVLDGATTGSAKFVVSTDRTGQIREVFPLCTANERSNDSAIRQIKSWKLEPLLNEGVPVQMESVLTFSVDTRAWGPRAPLNDLEARHLASNIVEPMFPADVAPSGTVYTLLASIDSEGYLIEVIPSAGPTGLFTPSYHALLKWQFHPYMENGEPRPFRALIDFRVP